MPSRPSRRRTERRLINQIAGHVRSTLDWFNRAAQYEQKDDIERALEHAYDHWQLAGIAICNLKNPGRVMRLVADALQHKLPINTGWRDDKILAAYKASHSSDVYVPFAEIKRKFVEMYGKENLPEDSSFRRTLKRLGCLNVGGTPGRPRKEPIPKRH
jgi:hypothetical protein